MAARKGEAIARGQNALANTIQDAVVMMSNKNFFSSLPKWERDGKLEWRQEHWDHVLDHLQDAPTSSDILANMAVLLELTDPSFRCPVGTSLESLCDQDVGSAAIVPKVTGKRKSKTSAATAAASSSASAAASAAPELSLRQDAFRKCLMLLIAKTTDKKVLSRTYVTVRQTTERDLVRAMLKIRMRSGSPPLFTPKVRPCCRDSRHALMRPNSALTRCSNVCLLVYACAGVAAAAERGQRAPVG